MGMSMPRPLMTRAFEAVREGAVPIVVAPTGYGKTMASPWIYREASRLGLASGLIHVAPLRGLVSKIYRDTFKPRVRESGYQAHIDLGDGRSSYFLKPLVVTTIDSFLWNLYRIPVAEAMNMGSGRSMGHYYPVYTSAYTSVTVFDEAHVYMGTGSPGVGRAAFMAALLHIARIGAPLVVETATMHPSMMEMATELLGGVGRSARIFTLDCNNTTAGGARGGEAVSDEEWVKRYTLAWETRVADGWSEVLEDIVRDSNRGPVLVVANTVASAISLYSRLHGDKRLGGRVALIHGRLASGDRIRAESLIGSLERGVIISTQVIEVGVDVNAIAVYTEAAPAENLVQRAGRACRKDETLERCRSEGSRIVIVKPDSTLPYPEEEVQAALRTIERLGGVDWRLPCPRQGLEPYTRLIEEAGAPGGAAALQRILQEIFDTYLTGDGRPTSILNLLDDIGVCSLYRDTVLIPLSTPGGEVGVDLAWLRRNWGKVLEPGRDGGVRVSITTPGGRVVEADIGEEALRRLLQDSGGCGRIYSDLQWSILQAAQNSGVKGPFRWSLKARPGSYLPGIGFSIDASTG